LATSSITLPGSYIFNDKKYDAAKGKRHQTADANRKLNEYKQKTERMKTENRMDENT
jgi:hypothetical protein